MGRKVGAMILALTMCMSVLGGCAGKEKETTSTSTAVLGEVDPFGKYEEPVEVTGVLSFSSASSEVPAGTTPENQSFVKQAKERFNIDFKWLWTAPTDQYEQKLGVAMASGELPDVMAVSAVDYQNLLENEQIMPWNDALEWASDTLREWIGRDPAVLESVTDENGNIMAIPQYWDSKRDLNIMMIRTDWLEQVNMGIPKTVEELEAVATAFKEQLGAEMGISLSKDVLAGTSPLAALMNMFGSYPTAWLEGEDGTLVPGEIQPETKEALETLNRFYEKGLIHKEFALHDATKLREFIVSEKLGILIAPWWAFDSFIGKEIAKNGDSKWATAPIPKAEGTNGALLQTMMIEDYYVLNANCKNPEAVIKLFNLWAQFETEFPEEAKAENGHVWNWVPTTYFDPYDIQTLHDNFNKQIETGDLKTVPEGINGGDIQLWGYAEDYFKWKAGEIPYDETNKWGKYLARIDDDFAWGTTEQVVENKEYELNKFYGLATDTMKERKATLNKLTEETYVKMVMGETPISEFEAYADSWLKLGGNEIIEEVNAWYQNQ